MRRAFGLCQKSGCRVLHSLKLSYMRNTCTAKPVPYVYIFWCANDSYWPSRSPQHGSCNGCNVIVRGKDMPTKCGRDSILLKEAKKDVCWCQRSPEGSCILVCIFFSGGQTVFFVRRWLLKLMFPKPLGLRDNNHASFLYQCYL